jgi:hypothetical protein
MTDPLDPLRNPSDPLHGSASDASLDLFKAVGKLAAGRPLDTAINVACNLLINAVRQSAPSWRQAEVLFDETFGRSKQLLKDHYDTNGRKKGIFPYDQVLMPELFIDPDKARQ